MEFPVTPGGSVEYDCVLTLFVLVMVGSGAESVPGI